MELDPLLLVFLLILNIHPEQTEDIKPTLSVLPQSSVFSGDIVLLNCEVNQSTGWEFIFITPSNHESTESTGKKMIRSVQVSDGGDYKCRARRRENQLDDTQYSEPILLTVDERPKAQVSVRPDKHVFRGETVTLTCDITGETSVTSWQYSWYKDDLVIRQYKLQNYTIRSVSESDTGKYTCRGTESSGSRSSYVSNAVTLEITEKPKAELTSDTEGSVLTEDTVTLMCLMNQSTGWKFYWYKHTQNNEKTITTDTNTYTMSSVRVSDGGQFWCRAGRGNPVYYTDYSDVLWINVTESPKAVVSVEPDKRLFSGETVTLRCDIQTKQHTEWTYRWTVQTYNSWNTVNQCKTHECKIENVYYYHSGKYTCRGESVNGQISEMSDAVTLTVSSYKPKTVLRVSPQQWLTEGDSVTLMCEVNRSSTGWTFSFTKHNLSSGYDLVSVSSGGSKGNYTVSSAALKHTGVYMCRAERGDPVYHTHNSNTQPLWITGVSSSVSLIIRPSRTQHFSSESLFLSCDSHNKSPGSGWTVRRYTNTLETCSSSSTWRSSGTESTCAFISLKTSDTGVYWCESESGHKLHHVNISIHNGDVILDSPVHPVTEGDSLTLHCLYRHTNSSNYISNSSNYTSNSSNFTAKFYKDGSVVQSQTTGDMMIISTVSKSHEGFYYCKHTERGESPESWISVTGAFPEKCLMRMSGLNLFALLLAPFPYILATGVLVFKCYRLRVTHPSVEDQYAVRDDETSV